MLFHMESGSTFRIVSENLLEYDLLPFFEFPIENVRKR